MAGIAKIWKRFVSWVKHLFRPRKDRIKSSEQVHWVNHIHDETVGVGGAWGTMQWGNLHGFEERNEQGGWTYWLGLDSRCWGIRISDMIIKCKDRATYDKYIEIAKWGGSDLLHAAENDSNLTLTRGNHVEIKFFFKWGGEEKTFNVRLAGDFYAEEK